MGYVNNARRGHSGFTLIEVVVALSVLALALGVLYESFGWALRRTSVLSHREAALLTAQSLLAEIRGRDVWRLGSERGSAPGSLAWEIRTRPWRAAIDERSPIRAIEVEIEVSWGAGSAQRIRLRSVETGRAEI